MFNQKASLFSPHDSGSLHKNEKSYPSDTVFLNPLILFILVNYTENIFILLHCIFRLTLRDSSPLIGL